MSDIYSIWRFNSLVLMHVTITSPNKTSQISQQLKVPTENDKSPNNKTVPTENHKSPNNKTLKLPTIHIKENPKAPNN